MRLAITAATFMALGGAAMAGPISFASGWQEQRLSLFSTNDYRFGSSLSMQSEGSVSIAWTRVGQGDWGADAASWNWTVEESVPATDLSRKGGDDRNLSIYFVFVPEASAPGLANANIRSLLGNSEVRIIQYAWGGNHGRGQVLPSPYGPRGQGVTIPLRQAGTGSHSENVDLAGDYARAFGGSKGALIGLAVSGDSDDTDSRIRAAIGGLTLR
ncbi:DUF3047 domain-containing protein [Paracoccus zeaxanthinifaciens]|uniref:DUF3047 domain-containing protein n=1 Tax=Paracoccus zeaxanthinifaciens TaxID=187400 RepID=UPI0003B32A66|nr:DUF3047 domain-containing protein [Paracoccus zeaxanthinifaciens]